MKVSGISSKILTNKAFLKTLEKISEHGTSFAATTSLILSLTIRPLSIYSTPDTEKENKQYAIANSIGSGLMKFAMVEAVALPIENAVKNIDKKPEKYLKRTTISRFIKDNSAITNSKSYKLSTQIIKLSAGLITAIPKSVLTIALIPIIMDKIFSVKNTNEEKLQNNCHNVSQNYWQPDNKLFFTGKVSENISKGLGKIIDNNRFQNFVIKNQNDDRNISKHITAATDVLLTSTSVIQTDRSDKIKENRKKALIYNNIVSTLITIVGGYGLDRLIKNKSSKFIDKFSSLNTADPKLAKYIEGINILRPALIFAFIYYCILPMFSTYIAEKIDKHINKNNS